MLRRTDEGGVLVLDGPRGPATTKAHELMTARCDGPYTILAEGDEYIDGRTEYRVRFSCGATPEPSRSQSAPDPKIPAANGS